MLKPFKFLLHSSIVGSLKKLYRMMRKTTNGIHYNKYESCAYLNTQNRLRLTTALHYKLPVGNINSDFRRVTLTVNLKGTQLRSVRMGQFTSRQWSEMTEVNKAAEEAETDQQQKQSSGGKKHSLTSKVKTRILRAGEPSC